MGVETMDEDQEKLFVSAFKESLFFLLEDYQ